MLHECAYEHRRTEDQEKDDCINLLTELNVLDSSTWPDDIPSTFGNSLMKAMCLHFGMEDKTAAAIK